MLIFTTVNKELRGLPQASGMTCDCNELTALDLRGFNTHPFSRLVYPHNCPQESIADFPNLVSAHDCTLY